MTEALVEELRGFALDMDEYGDDNFARKLRLAANHIEAISSENERLKALLRRNFCPRPTNTRPDFFEIGACIDAGECGCINCDALLRSSTEEER